jgi:hypothetical protein
LPAGGAFRPAAAFRWVVAFRAGAGLRAVATLFTAAATLFTAAATFFTALVAVLRGAPFLLAAGRTGRRAAREPFDLAGPFFAISRLP